MLAVRRARHGRRSGSTSLRGAGREVVAHPPDYIHVGMSTAVAFTLFGYILGRQADRLAELSKTDALTGLFNARGLFDRLDAELARSRRYREPLALLFVDLDGLKSINDRYGHRAGDDAIRSLADVIRSELRESDVGARWGGDEFAVLAPSTSKVAALALAERIRALIPERSTRWPLSASVGVATLAPRTDGAVVDPATLMRAADAAMYEAKRSGRNRVGHCVAKPYGRWHRGAYGEVLDMTTTIESVGAAVTGRLTPAMKSVQENVRRARRCGHSRTARRRERCRGNYAAGQAPSLRSVALGVSAGALAGCMLGFALGSQARRGTSEAR